jgi:hypothetical protein
MKIRRIRSRFKKMKSSLTLSIPLRVRMGLEQFMLSLDADKKKRPSEQILRFSVLSKIEVPDSVRKQYFNLSGGTLMVDWEGIDSAPAEPVEFNELEIDDLELVLDSPMSLSDMRWQNKMRQIIKSAREAKAQVSAAGAE